MAKRGAFIVLEGLDRSGKSTQCAKLVENLVARGVRTKGIRFPDRETATGRMIDAYLKQSAELDDHAIHLLFSVNRWEKANAIRQDLQAGMTVVCDRYAFSGIAFTAAKGLNYDWCKAPDIGLPAPDATFFLSVSPEVAAQRGGYGEERYESNDIQSKVRTIFQQIATEVGPARWRKINADGPKHDIEQELLVAALKVCEGVDSTIVSNLWQPV